MERSGDRLCVLSRSLRRLGFTAGLLYFMFLATDAHRCPDTCRCQNRSMTCVDSPALVLPLELSRRTQNLTLKGNNISTLIERAFWGNGTDLDLRALSLQDNNIQAIESCAFCEVTRLHFLDLSYNRFMFVSPDAFRGLGELRSLYLRDAVTPSGARLLAGALSAHALPHLQRLDLSGNRLKAMPLYGFGNFDLTTLILTNNSLETLDKVNVTEFIKFSKIRVYLSLNQFVCDCDLEPFHDWLKNSSQCADADLLTCLQSGEKRAARPEKLKNVSFLECSDQKLEAVSYVFLGIVMALIGVVFLMVLYLNRRGIKRWLNNIREACRDQMEVYHYRYEQDSDPRLANVAV